MKIFQPNGMITDEHYSVSLPATLEEVRLWNEDLRQIVVDGRVINVVMDLSHKCYGFES